MANSAILGFVMGDKYSIGIQSTHWELHIMEVV